MKNLGHANGYFADEHVLQTRNLKLLAQYSRAADLGSIGVWPFLKAARPVLLDYRRGLSSHLVQEDKLGSRGMMIA